MKSKQSTLLFIVTSVLSLAFGRLHKRRALQGEGDIFDTVTFLVTYRDFLPAGCASDINNPSAAVRALIEEQQDAFDTTALPVRNRCRFLADNNDWKGFIESGIIKGHPDFNVITQTEAFDDCQAAQDEGNIPIGTCRDRVPNRVTPTEILKEDLVENDAGIPKPAYCLDGPLDSCGFNLDNNKRQTSEKRFFDSWYNDDLQFNKKVAQPLILNRVDNTDTFIFRNDDNDSPADVEGDLTPSFFGPLARFKIGENALGLTAFADPRDFPAWPKAFNDDIGFWMTTELHTTFEFFKDADMAFTFLGDDDFWAFVNGKMIIDLQGIHAAQSATIDLNSQEPLNNGQLIAEFLGLEDGNVYTLDIFHAERNVVDSNFEMTTALFPACNVLQSGSTAFDFGVGVSEFDFEDLFVASDNVDRLDDNSFRLISDENLFSASFIFTKIAENVGRGFVAKFNVKVSGPTDGFALIVQNRGIEDYPLSIGGNMNILGVTNSFAVVFDYCTNRNEEGFDGTNCAGQDVRVHHAEKAEDPNSAGEDTKRVFDNIVRSNGRLFNEFKVEIIFFGDRPDFLEVYIDDSLTLREKNFDIEGILGNLGAFVGFTASTSAQAADIVISDFVLDTVEVDATQSQDTERREAAIEEGVLLNRTILADGEELGEGVSFQTFDFCGNEINTGTLAILADGLFVEQLNETSGFFGIDRLVPNVEPAEIIDNNDGSYTTAFVTEVPGVYQAFASFGDDCKLKVDLPKENETDVLVFANVELLGDPDLCFQTNLENAAEALVVIVDDPTDIEFEEQEDEDLSLYLLGAGGGFLVLILLGSVLFAYYRNKWKRNAAFVKPGQEYLLELNTNITGGEEYQNAGLAVLHTQKEILNLKTQASNDPRTNEIETLSSENAELKQMISEAKKNDSSGYTEGNPRAAKQSRNPKYKVEF